MLLRKNSTPLSSAAAVRVGATIWLASLASSSTAVSYSSMLTNRVSSWSCNCIRTRSCFSGIALVQQHNARATHYPISSHQLSTMSHHRILTPRRYASTSSSTVESTQTTNASATPASPSAALPSAAAPSPPVRFSCTSSTYIASSSSLLGPPGRIMIYASEVASLIGLNPYSHFPDVFDRIWARTDPEAWKQRRREVEQVLGVRLLSREEQAKEILDSEDGAKLQKLLTDTLARVTELSHSELASSKAELTALSSTVPSITHLTRTLLTDYVIGEVSKSYGILNEQRAIESYERVVGVKVVEGNQMFYGREIGVCGDTVTNGDATIMTIESSIASATTSSSTSDDTSSISPSSALRTSRSLWLGGRVDGFSSTTGSLIEMKNRTSRFLTPLPLYDRCQMEVYLQICEREDGELVERLRKKVSPEQAASEQSRLQYIREARQRMQEQEELEVRWRKELEEEEEAEMEGQDRKWLRQQQHSEGVNSLSILPSTSNSESTFIPTSSDPVAAEDQDLDFLSDPSPLIHIVEEESDSSFLGAPPSSAPSITSSFFPSASSHSSAQFEIFGTQHLFGFDTADASITHILIRESSIPRKEITESSEDIGSVGKEVVLENVEVNLENEEEFDEAFLASDELVAGFMQASQPEIVEAEDANATSEATMTTADPMMIPSASVTSSSPSSITTSTTSTTSSSSLDSHLYIDQLKRTQLSRNNLIWSSRILPDVLSFGNFFTRFLSDNNMQVKYLMCRTDEEKREFLKDVIPKKVRKGTEYHALMEEKPRGRGRSKDASASTTTSDLSETDFDASFTSTASTSSSSSSFSTEAPDEQTSSASRRAARISRVFTGE